MTEQEMRPIDANRLNAVLRNIREHTETDKTVMASSLSVFLDYAMEIVGAQPTITPQPNAPLTLEELREMDGEPVWVECPGYGKRWALVQVWAKSTNVIYFTYNNGSTSLVQVVIDCGGKAYRRKTEEGTVWQQ